MKAAPIVLIVDDIQANLVALESVLEPLHITVVKATSGDEALRLTLHHDFALAIFDVQMPIMDGYELAKLIRGDKRTRNIPIIFVSAIYSDAMHQFKGYQSGAVDFINKPFNPDILLSKVRIFLELHQHGRESIERAQELEAILAIQKRTEKNLRSAEEFNRRIIQASPDCIKILDPNGRVVFFSDGGLRLLGIKDSNEIIGKDYREFWKGSDKTECMAALESARGGEVGRFTGYCPDAKGQPMWWDVIITLLDESAQRQFLIISRDITERKRAEQFRADVERIIRHDIKTPLCSLQGMAQLALKDRMNDNLRLLVPGLLHSIRHVINHLNSFESIILMEQDAYTPQSTWFDLRHVMHNVNLSLEPLTTTKNVRLLHMGALEPSTQQDTLLLFGEETLIEGMLLNLVKNAVEASLSGGDIRISYCKNHREQRIDIHNHGVVPENIRDKFFDKYATSGKSHGTGLGTYSAQLIAKAHGGRIEFTTSEAEGTTVRVILPCPK